MSKERLEEIEEIDEEVSNGFALEDLNLNTMTVVSRGHFEWLIEQAERVHELKEENISLKAIKAGNEELIKMLEQQNKRYREALEFYADDEAWGLFDHHGRNQINMDGGKIARKALEGESK